MYSNRRGTGIKLKWAMKWYGSMALIMASGESPIGSE
jgi:hypothetical protein